MDFDQIDEASLRRLRGVKWARCDADVLPAWVADMDFPVAQPIRRALSEMVATSDFGYPPAPTASGLATIFAQRMERRFGWIVDPASVEVLTDVVQGLQIAISLFSEAGDGIIVPMPIYPPFLDAVAQHKRKPVWQRFVWSNGGYRIDIERLRAELTPDVRMLLLCNPHNPTGRVLSPEELGALVAIAVERDLVIVSDEIHAELVYRGRRHTPTATLGPEIAARTITLTSASKAFNIAGLRCAVAVFGTPELRRRFLQVHPHMRGGIGTLGLAATGAAWSGECDTWLDDVLAYLENNRDIVHDHIVRHWPAIRHAPPEATYLSWLDCQGLGLDVSPQKHFLGRSRVLLSEGRDFGEAGRGCVRLNFATSRTILEKILRRMSPEPAR